MQLNFFLIIFLIFFLMIGKLILLILLIFISVEPCLEPAILAELSSMFLLMPDSVAARETAVQTARAAIREFFWLVECRFRNRTPQFTLNQIGLVFPGRSSLAVVAPPKPGTPVAPVQRF